MTAFVLGETPLSCSSLMAAVDRRVRFVSNDAARARMREAHAVVERICASGERVYGVNTGVGSQKDYAVNAVEHADFGCNEIRGHATRVPGPVADEETLRATLAIQLSELASG